MKRNPIAKDLRTPKYKMRVVEPKNRYKRKEKHPLTFPLFEGKVGLLAGER